MLGKKRITLLAATVLFAPALASADDTEAPGWGMAIAARVIGEKCTGALEPGEIATLNEFISAQFAQSVEASGKGVAWWADLRDKLEHSYVEKYADAANCTKDAREEAEDMVEDVRNFQQSASAR